MKEIKPLRGVGTSCVAGTGHGKLQLSCGDDSVRPGWMGEGHLLPAL